jgi:hypothetical protein
MMRLTREILALLLVSLLLLVTGGWAESDYWLGLSNRLSDNHLSDDHPAGCHAIGGGSLAGSGAPQQIPHSPERAPERHECCLTGHDVTALAVSYSFQPLIWAQRVTVQIAPGLSTCFFDAKSVSMFAFADPPGIISLRI